MYSEHCRDANKESSTAGFQAVEVQREEAEETWLGQYTLTASHSAAHCSIYGILCRYIPRPNRMEATCAWYAQLAYDASDDVITSLDSLSPSSHCLRT